MKFNYLNLHTVFSYTTREVGNKDKVIAKFENNVLAPNAASNSCFFKYFSDGKNGVYDNDFELRIYNDASLGDDFLCNNYCFISPKQLEWYLEELKQIVPFEYTLTKADKKFLHLKVSTRGLSKYENKWLLTSIRSCYEFPSSFALREAITFKDHPSFEGENIINLFHMILFITGGHVGSHTIPLHNNTRMGEFMTYDELRKAIKSQSKRGDSLNELYKKHPKLTSAALKYFAILEDMTENQLDTKNPGKYLEHKGLSYMRLEKIYIPMYKKLKK